MRSAAATARAEPLVVQLRWHVHVALLLVLLVVVAVLVGVRRGDDLDFEDQLGSAGALVLCAWLFALGAGTLLRSVMAGHALKVDRDGLHVPGAAPVPWSAVESADLGADGSESWRLRSLVVHTRGLPALPIAETYERYLFGPLVGLRGWKGRISLPVGILDVDAARLLAVIRAFILQHGHAAAHAGAVHAKPRA